jgi:Putative MetA-pathway of phenol degradation
VRSIRSATLFVAILADLLLAGVVSPARAQDIEPRAYSNAPVGVNFLIAGYAYTRGGVSFDPAVPITNARLTTSNAVLAYARVLDLWGKSGKFDAILPYTWLSGTADVEGQPAQRIVNGFANPAFRLSINFYGAPALTLKEFAGWEQDLIIGASLQVSPSLGQYDAGRLVNIGTNRWSFKPEIGVSKVVGPWTLEIQVAATFFTDNADFYGGKTRSQDPLYSLQGHLIYGFRSGIWVSVDGTYFAGGRTTVDGVLNNDLQQNWRAGATLALPVDRANSIKFYASSGFAARTGNNYDLVGVAWQNRWGGGL